MRTNELQSSWESFLLLLR